MNKLIGAMVVKATLAFGLFAIVNTTGCQLNDKDPGVIKIDIKGLRARNITFREFDAHEIPITMIDANSFSVSSLKAADLFYEIAFANDYRYCPNERCFAPSLLIIDELKTKLNEKGIKFGEGEDGEDYRYLRFAKKRDFDLAILMFEEMGGALNDSKGKIA